MQREQLPQEEFERGECREVNEEIDRVDDRGFREWRRTHHAEPSRQHPRVHRAPIRVERVVPVASEIGVRDVEIGHAVLADRKTAGGGLQRANDDRHKPSAHPDGGQPADILGQLRVSLCCRRQARDCHSVKGLSLRNTCTRPIIDETLPALPKVIPIDVIVRRQARATRAQGSRS